MQIAVVSDGMSGRPGNERLKIRTCPTPGCHLDRRVPANLRVDAVVSRTLGRHRYQHRRLQEQWCERQLLPGLRRTQGPAGSGGQCLATDDGADVHHSPDPQYLPAGPKRDVQPIYTAPKAAAAPTALEEIMERRRKMYGAIVRLWENAWDEFSPFLDYVVEIRRVSCSQRHRSPERPVPAGGEGPGSFPDRAGRGTARSFKGAARHGAGILPRDTGHGRDS
jgi:hypothetical protein